MPSIRQGGGRVVGALAIMSFIVLFAAPAAGASTGPIVEFATSAAPDFMTVGPDGALWFTSRSNGGTLARVTTSGGEQDFAMSPIDLSGVAAGPDGAIWVTGQDEQTFDYLVARVNLSGTITDRFTVPDVVTAYDIVQGSDGNLWFAGVTTGNQTFIARITTSGDMTRFDVPDVRPRDLTVGPDGAIWYTDLNTHVVGKITPDGTATTVSVPGAPQGLTVGSDGTVYFGLIASPDVARIGEVSPQGAVTDVPIVGCTQSISSMVEGPDGNAWFVTGARAIGRITPSNDISIWRLPDGPGTPGDMVSTAGDVWYTRFLSTVDPGVVGRSPTEPDATPFPTDPCGQQVPVGTIGLFGLAAMLGAGFVLVQMRSRRKVRAR